MRYSPRQKRLREQRSAFLFFLTFSVVYLVAAYPVVAGTLAPHSRAASRLLPPFAQLDRNHDGYVDSSEAAGFPAYAGTFSWADESGDGRLSRGEFAAALNRLERAP
jgi:hypothetical protein